MAAENARLSDALEADEAGRRLSALRALADRLGMDDVPRRIHCIDVSTIQGTSTVASRVCFVDGQPDRAGYRKFRIRGDAAAEFDEARLLGVHPMLRAVRGHLEDLAPLDHELVHGAAPPPPRVLDRFGRLLDQGEAAVLVEVVMVVGAH